MKKSILSIICVSLAFGLTYAQDGGAYMYETIYLTPIPGKISELNKGLSAHNKKYHGEGDYTAFVQTVLSGAHSGDYVWVMGPGNFARLDSRPAIGGHDDDWNTNVMPHISKISDAGYWVRDDKAHYTPKDYSGDKIRIREYKVKQGMNQKAGEMFTKITEVYSEKAYDRTLALYWNQFPTADNGNMVSVSGFSKWALFDKESTFDADFESINGSGSWAKWIAEWQSLLEWTDQEVRATIPELGGIEN